MTRMPPRAIPYVASAWLVLVAGNLVLGGYLDVAVRDFVLAVAAYTLARLTELQVDEPRQSLTPRPSVATVSATR